MWVFCSCASWLTLNTWKSYYCFVFGRGCFRVVLRLLAACWLWIFCGSSFLMGEWGLQNVVVWLRVLCSFSMCIHAFHVKCINASSHLLWMDGSTSYWLLACWSKEYAWTCMCSDWLVLQCSGRYCWHLSAYYSAILQTPVSCDWLSLHITCIIW